MHVKAQGHYLEGGGNVLNIIQKVVVKQVLTEASKQDLENRFINRKQALEKEMEQLKFQLKHMEKPIKVLLYYIVNLKRKIRSP